MADTNFLMDNLRGSVPIEIANEVIKGIVTDSIALQICKKVPMQSDTKVLPMLTDSGKAYWVDEGEKIGTTLNAWKYPELVAKKLAVIIPVTREKLSDSVLDVMEELKSGIAEQFVKAIDSAVFFGTDSPFESSVFGAIEEESKVECESESEFATSISNALGKVEQYDLVPNSIVASPTQKKVIRNAKDSNGNALITNTGVLEQSSIYQTPISYVTSGAFDNSRAQVLVGDFSRAILGIRDDIEYSTMTQGTVGDINLGERDIIAIKCTMRIAFNCVDSKAFALVKPITA